MNTKADEEFCLDYGVKCNPYSTEPACCYPLECFDPEDEYRCFLRSQKFFLFHFDKIFSYLFLNAKVLYNN